MAIVTNNNNLGTAIGALNTGNGMEVQFFTVTVKNNSILHDGGTKKIRQGFYNPYRWVIKTSLRYSPAHVNHRLVSFLANTG